MMTISQFGRKTGVLCKYFYRLVLVGCLIPCMDGSLALLALISKAR